MVEKRKTLTLILTAGWYDLIHCGYKKEEYRDIKPYYNSRFENKTYERVVFINGYHTNARRMCLEVKKISKGLGRKEWGSDRKDLLWVISLGKMLWVGKEG